LIAHDPTNAYARIRWRIVIGDCASGHPKTRLLYWPAEDAKGTKEMWKKRRIRKGRERREEKQREEYEKTSVPSAR